MQQLGRYQVLDKLGQGGMGTVYKAYDPQLGRVVALKSIVLNVAVDPLAVARFQREAEALARLRHPGVVRIHGLEKTERGATLVMELVEGTVLRELARQGPVPCTQAAEVVRELADAVAAAHREGILHRDLKPANVILRDEKPVLLDFGIARDLDAQTLTRTGAMVGTPAYMPPEQAGGEKERICPASDVYGLGTILFELLAGRPPFEGSSFALIKKVLNDDPTWPSAKREDVPAELEAVLRVAMAKEPAERYDSAEALREDLDCFLAGRPTQAGRRKRLPQATDERSRAPSVAAGAGLILVLALAAAGLSSAGREPASPAPPPSSILASAAASPTPSQAKAAAPTPLWRLETGQQFQAAVSCDEQARTVQLRLDTDVTVTVEAADERTARLRFDFVDLCAVFRAGFPADAPAEEHDNMTALMRRVLGPLTCTLDQATGRLSEWDGFLAIRQRIDLEAQSDEVRAIEKLFNAGEDAETSPIQIAGTLKVLLDDGYLGKALGIVFQARANPWLTWNRVQRQTVPDPRFKAAEERQPGNVLVPFLLRDKRASRAPQLSRNRGRGVDLKGELWFRGGRISEAYVRQTSRPLKSQDQAEGPGPRRDDFLEWRWRSQ